MEREILSIFSARHRPILICVPIIQMPELFFLPVTLSIPIVTFTKDFERELKFSVYQTD